MKYKQKLTDLVIQELVNQNRVEEIELILSYKSSKEEREQVLESVYNDIKRKLKS